MRIKVPKKITLLIGIAGLALLIIAIGIIENQGVQNPKIRHSNYTLPITERHFLIGMVPTPRGGPNATFEDVLNAYQEVAGLGEVAMLWVSPSGIGEYMRLNSTRVVEAVRVYGLKPIITLNFATLVQVNGSGLVYTIDAPPGVPANLSDPTFRALWTEEAEAIARAFRPDYFSLGNEVNDYFHFRPDDLGAYLTLLDEAYAAIKQASPSTKVMVVFSYNHMNENDQFGLLGLFSNRTDLIGLTTYPWKYFDKPGDIPADYYSKIRAFTNKTIAFTEIGWVSSDAHGSSESEQAEFLVQFLNSTKGIDLEIVNWLFLHEPQLNGTAAVISDPAIASIALKNSDGSKKEIYFLWQDLKELRIAK